MSITKTYFTIEIPFSTEITEKGSKFIAYLFPVKDETAIKNQIHKIKMQHPKARHWCFAWRLGIDGTSYKASDDGEPSGTAGRPILNQMDSKELTNALLVVVRYFGGTLLGTSGLINAYKDVSKKCIAQSVILKFEIIKKYQIESNHAIIQMLIGIFKELDISILNYSMDEKSSIFFQLPLENEELIFRKIKSKLEKTNLSQVENPRQLKDCIISEYKN